MMSKRLRGTVEFPDGWEIRDIRARFAELGVEPCE